MSAKVQWHKDAWWVVTHWSGKRRWKQIGAAKSDKRAAEKIAEKINASISLGAFDPDAEERKPIPFDQHVRAWHRTYSPTFKPSHERNALSAIERTLIPFFGSRDLREIREADLLEFIRQKLEAPRERSRSGDAEARAGYSPSTILYSLSILRRVLNLAIRDGLIDRNPANRLGEIMRRVNRRTAPEVRHADSWTPAEVATLLACAREDDAKEGRAASPLRFHTALLFLFSTGARRGEALGLKWEDVDFDAHRVHIRRAIVQGAVTTPKSGRGRLVAMPPGLASALFDLLAERRSHALKWGWRAVPEWVFAAQTGGPIEERNFERSWQRVRRKAQRAGVRPFKLHCTRHSYASLALAAGKSVRWVAEQLGHSNPELTLRTYAHVLRHEETDLSFADFGSSSGGAGRQQTAPTSAGNARGNDPGAATQRAHSGIVERETGVEPATLSLGS
jgi:integrase